MPVACSGKSPRDVALATLLLGIRQRGIATFLRTFTEGGLSLSLSYRKQELLQCISRLIPILTLRSDLSPISEYIADNIE